MFKIGKVIKLGDNNFIASCKADKTNESGRTILTCQPQMEKNGRIIKSPSPVEIHLEGRRAILVDDGGASTELLDKLIKHVEKFALG
jgi:glutamine phosphoribosylpyrophosphate amidotransferase